MEEGKKGPRIPPSSAALLVVDMQNGFLHPEGALGRDGAPVEPMWEIVPRVAELHRLCRQMGIPDIWSIQETLAEDKARAARRIPAHTVKRSVIPCLKDTWDAEIVADLKPLIDEKSTILRKNRFSCFYNTNLEYLLRAFGATTLILTGVTTQACVERTAREAYLRELDVLVVEDCVASQSEAFHRASLQVMNRYFGLVIPLRELSGILTP